MPRISGSRPRCTLRTPMRGTSSNCFRKILPPVKMIKSGDHSFSCAIECWRILITADRNRETIELRHFPQAAKHSFAVGEQRLEVGITQL